jgi:hypothetical protein
LCFVKQVLDVKFLTFFLIHFDCAFLKNIDVILFH